MTKYCISDLIMEIAAPDWALHDNLKLFSCRQGNPDIHCKVVFKKRPDKPAGGVKIIADTPGTLIFEDSEFIHNLSGDDHDIPSYTAVSMDWSAYTMFVDPEYNNPDDAEIVQVVQDGIHVSLREIMIGRLAQKNGVIIHSSTILWQGRGIMFSAPAGTGKSTHAHLWQQLYHTPILDGDSAACRVADGTPVVYGLPWCGTSGEFLNQSAPLGAIVFLQQAQENSIVRLDLRESIIRLAARCFLLPWNEKLMHQYLDTVQEIAAKTDCYLLNCRPDFAAVELVKKCL